MKQGKIVAKLLPTEARLREWQSSEVPQKQNKTNLKLTKVIPQEKQRKEKKSYSGHLLTASAGRQ